MKLIFTRSNILVAMTALSIGICLSAPVVGAEAGAGAPVFARVGEVVISQREFDAAFATSSRGRFYHGKPPEAEVASLQREIADKLVVDALLLIEAKRLKLKPDAEQVKKKLEEYEQRNAGKEQWQKIRERALPELTRMLENESLRSIMEQRARTIKVPSEKQLRKFYAANPDKFTEPEQVRVSLILLKIDPSENNASWEAAREFGQGLIKQMKEGANFEELAMKYSGDVETAPQGGDMGYLHGGMMSGLPAEVVKNLKPGEISDVVKLMEGMAIFKLTVRNEAKLSSFDQVKERAKALWLDAESKRVWKAFIAKLRKNVPVIVNESRFLPLDAPEVKDTSAPVAK